MSPMARILLGMGWQVSGSDIKPSAHLQALQALGAKVFTGHSAGNVGDASLVVVSAAVGDDNPEVVEARKRAIPVVSRAEMLGRLMRDYVSIGVTGTHGKTTTTAMIATVLEYAGLDPTALVGADLGTWNGGGRLGRGRYLVAEADEAYGSFLKMRPNIAVVTNIDADHLDYYGSFARIVSAFEEFLRAIPPSGLAVLCVDDPAVRDIAQRLAMREVTYGLSEGVARPDLSACDVQTTFLGSRFTVTAHGKALVRVELNVPGTHNISNALAAVAVGRELSIEEEKIARALASYRGAKRRCEIIGEVGGVLVMDDYAHHPTEVETTLRALKDSGNRRLIVAFQPQRFTRTMHLGPRFAKAFRSADLVVVTEIYYEGTGEEPIPGVTGERLARMIGENEPGKVTFVPDKNAIPSYLLSAIRPGDLVVTMGAGDIWRAAHELVKMLAASAKGEAEAGARMGGRT